MDEEQLSEKSIRIAELTSLKENVSVLIDSKQDLANSEIVDLIDETIIKSLKKMKTIISKMGS